MNYLTTSKPRNKRKKTHKIRPGVLVGFSLLLFCIVALIWQCGGQKVYDDVMYPREYAEYVAEYAKQYQLDEDLVYAVIKTESGFDPDAVSYVDARGLMQVTEDTFHWINTKLGYTDYQHDDLHDPALGIEYGCFLLGYLQELFDGEVEVMLAAYHAGMNITAEWLENTEYSADGRTLQQIPYEDTAHYVDKVMTNYDAYRQQ